MNIFVLDKDPQVAAAFHCNKHVVKMILESGQMMCTTHWLHLLRSKNLSLKDFRRIRDAQQWLFDNTDNKCQPPWKMSHTKHPCTIWTGINSGNYEWHLRLMRGLLDEYTKRYQKSHKSEAVYQWLAKNRPIQISRGQLTEHPQCMPDECKVTKNPVKAYRNYYTKYKNHFAKWEPRSQTPNWYQETI